MLNRSGSSIDPICCDDRTHSLTKKQGNIGVSQTETNEHNRTGKNEKIRSEIAPQNWEGKED